MAKSLNNKNGWGVQFFLPHQKNRKIIHWCSHIDGLIVYFVDTDLLDNCAKKWFYFEHIDLLENHAKNQTD